jgi:ATP-dependent DNA helicase RecQ
LTHEEIRDALGLSVTAEAIGSSLQIIARTGVLERLETGGGLAMVRIDSELPTLVDLLPKEATVKRKVMRALERIIGQRRGEAVYIHPRWLMQELDMDRDAMNRNLRELCKVKGVDYVPPFRGRAIHILKRDVPFAELEIDFGALAKRKEAEYERLNQVVRYAQSPRCRQATILEYFGDTAAIPCGHCDRCLGAHGWPHLAQKLRGTQVSEPQEPRSADSGTLAPSVATAADQSAVGLASSGIESSSGAFGPAGTGGHRIPPEIMGLLHETLLATRKSPSCGYID